MKIEVPHTATVKVSIAIKTKKYSVAFNFTTKQKLRFYCEQTSNEILPSYYVTGKLLKLNILSTLIQKSEGFVWKLSNCLPGIISK